MSGHEENVEVELGVAEVEIPVGKKEGVAAVAILLSWKVESSLRLLKAPLEAEKRLLMNSRRKSRCWRTAEGRLPTRKRALNGDAGIRGGSVCRSRRRRRRSRGTARRARPGRCSRREIEMIDGLARSPGRGSVGE
jgi:hypothetical protein